MDHIPHRCFQVRHRKTILRGMCAVANRLIFCNIGVYLAIFFAIYLDEVVFGTMWLDKYIPVGDTGKRFIRAIYWPLIQLFRIGRP